jgi:alpha-N-acetylglucosaminidase
MLHGFNRYDLVDLTRQALAKYANQIFLRIIQGYKSNNISQVTTMCELFLDLVNDLDMLLASHEGFLLGPWLESAKGLARDQEQEIQVIPFSSTFLVLDGFILTCLMVTQESI